MSDASQPVQVAVVAALETAAGLADVAIYDEPPAEAEYPYVTVAQVVNVSDVHDCFDGCEVTVTLHICDTAPGKKMAQQIAKAAVAAIDTDLVVDGFDLHIHEHMTSNFTIDFESDVRGVVVQRYALQVQ